MNVYEVNPAVNFAALCTKTKTKGAKKADLVKSCVVWRHFVPLVEETCDPICEYHQMPAK